MKEKERGESIRVHFLPLPLPILLSHPLSPQSVYFLPVSSPCLLSLSPSLLSPRPRGLVTHGATLSGMRVAFVLGAAVTTAAVLHLAMFAYSYKSIASGDGGRGVPAALRHHGAVRQSVQRILAVPLAPATHARSLSLQADSVDDDGVNAVSSNRSGVETSPSLPTFCSVDDAVAAGTSRFHEVVGDAVRAAALKASNVDPESAMYASSVLTLFQRDLAAQAPCFWAPFTGVPLPREVTMSVCTHDPSVDQVISRIVHQDGAWADWASFETLLVDGSCPPDRPVVLDLGLNIG